MIVRKLSNIGVLGINRRNALYTLQYNPRKLYPLVDDKLLTKQLALKAGIAVPKLYGMAEIQRQIKDLNSLLKPYKDFVVKPAHGHGGVGIMVIKEQTRNMYRQVNDLLITHEELKHHFSNILTGMYSIGGSPDKALIEYRVQFDPVFNGISYLGVPDIRIIVFLGIPVMSMVRLPTRLSEGKANLHQGAIGVGIDISKGTTLTGVQGNDIIYEHPDTGNPVSGVLIPGWEDLLKTSARCYELTGLGYQGVDIVLDKDLGPLILEINARPGLNIQIANRAGLMPRMDLIENHYKKLTNVDERVAFARNNFGA
ncbi:MAG: alpha-L-glutamate ligase-like protein [Thermodesulfobacteriota bacterium]|nr:alpha-L-glutamate ligase-like protein [Thermodesulfobacteriota bacterium]